MNKKILIGIIILAVVIAGIIFIKSNKPSGSGIEVVPAGENSGVTAALDNAPASDFAPLDTAESDFGEIDSAIDSFE